MNEEYLSDEEYNDSVSGVNGTLGADNPGTIPLQEEENAPQPEFVQPEPERPEPAPAAEAPAAAAPAYTEDEMWNLFRNGSNYTEDQVLAMNPEERELYRRTAAMWNVVNATDEERKAYRKGLQEKLALTDRLEKMTEFIAKETEDDPELKAIHDEAVNSNRALADNKMGFATKLSDDKLAWFANDIQKKYDEASRRRGFLDTMADAFRRGHESINNMIYSGYVALKPSGVTEEDATNLRALHENEQLDNILNPKKYGDAFDSIHSVGDAIEWGLEGFAENVERMAYGAAAATAGAIVGGGVGAVLLGSAGTMLANTGEAVNDQLDDHPDGDIRNSIGWARAQGLGYSILDGAFGANAFAGKVWGGIVRKVGGGLIKGEAVDAARKIATNRTLWGVVKDVALHAGLGEGVQEAVQSQGVGRLIRYLQTGSFLREDETTEDAGREAANEFLGGMATGLTFGLLGGASANFDARRASRISHNIQGILKEDKTYQSLDEYTKLLVDVRLRNDALLESTSVLGKEERQRLAEANAQIDAEIDRMAGADNKDEQERAVGQSARAYLDIFKSQYSLADLDEATRAMGNAPTEVDRKAMLANAERRVDKDGRVTTVYTDPTTGISIAEFPAGEDGKRKYVFHNSPERKSPIFGSDELVLDSFDKAFEKAVQLDRYNRWREQKLDQKAEIAQRVFDHMFGGRGVNLRFVDRPTSGVVNGEPTYVYDQKTGKAVEAGTKSVAGTTAAYSPENNTVELSLDNINSLGSLYTSLIHERSHEDIVEFLMRSPKWMKKVGEMTRPDWDAFNRDREELFAKVNGAEAMSAVNREKGAKLDRKTGHYDKVRNDWGLSAGKAGEEMVVERESVRELAEQIHSLNRGPIGGLVDRVKRAIGTRMALDMGLDPAAIMADLDSSVRAEIDKIYKIGYVGRPAPEGFEREKAGKNRKFEAPANYAATTEEFAKRFGEKVSGGAKEEGKGGAAPAESGRTLTPPLKDGEGASYPAWTTIHRADGAIFARVDRGDGTMVWQNLDTKEEASDSEATAGGFSVVGSETKSKQEASPKPETKSETDATSDDGYDDDLPPPDYVDAPDGSPQPLETAPQGAPNAEGTTSRPNAAKAAKAASRASGEGSSANTAPKAKSGAGNATESAGGKASQAKAPSVSAPAAPAGGDAAAAAPKAGVKGTAGKSAATGKKVAPGKSAEVKAAPTPKPSEASGSQESPRPAAPATLRDLVSSFSKVLNGLKAGGVSRPEEYDAAVRTAASHFKSLSDGNLYAEIDILKKKDKNSSSDPYHVLIGVANDELGRREKAKKAAEGSPASAETKNETAPAAKPETETPSEKPAQEDGKPAGKKPAATKTRTSKETNKKVETASGEKVSPESAPVAQETGSSASDTESVKKAADGDARNAELDKTLGERLKADAPNATDKQKEAIKRMMGEYGKFPDAIRDLGGLVSVVFDKSKPYFFDKDGNGVSVGEVKRIISGQKSEKENGNADSGGNRSFHTRLAELPRVMDFNGGEQVGSEYSGLSESRLLYLASHDGNVIALKRLFRRFAVNPPKRLNGGLPKWFADRGVKPGKEMDTWLTKVWYGVLGVMKEADRLQLNGEEAAMLAADLKRKIDDRVAVLASEGVSNLAFDPTIRTWRAELAQMTGPDTNPLGKTVSAENLIYRVANDVWSEKEAEDYAAERQAQLKEEARKSREAAEEARRLRAQRQEDDEGLALIYGKTVAEIQHDRAVANSAVIPPFYKGDRMPIARLVDFCFPKGGRSADPIAKNELIVRVWDILDREFLSEKGDWKTLAGSDKDQVASDVVKAFMDAMANFRRFEIGFGESGRSDDRIFRDYVMGYANRIAKDANKTRAADKVTSYDQIENARLKREDKVDREAEDDGTLVDSGDMDASDNRKSATEEKPKADDRKSDSDGESEDKLRQRRGWFGSAEEAVEHLVGNVSGYRSVLTPSQSLVLTSLLDAWRTKAGDAFERLQDAKARGGVRGNTISALERRYREATRLKADDNDVIELASGLAGMKPKVYRARLDRILEWIELAFLGKENHDAWRAAEDGGDPMPVRLMANRRRVRSGRFGRSELEYRLDGIADIDPTLLIGYNSGELVELMKRNGDERMARVVNLARQGKTNAEIQAEISRGLLKGASSMDSGGYSNVAETLLRLAFEDYGWIDTRIDKRLEGKGVLKRQAAIFGDVISQYEGDRILALATDENVSKTIDRLSLRKNAWIDFENRKAFAKAGGEPFEELSRKVRKWVSVMQIGIRRADYDSVFANAVLRAILDSDYVRGKKAKAGRERAMRAHDLVASLLAENGGDRGKVTTALKNEHLLNDTEVERAFAHYDRVEKDAADAAARVAASKARREAEGKELDEARKTEAHNAYVENGRNVMAALASLKAAGWDDRRLGQAENVLRYRERQDRKSEEEAVAAMSLSQRSDVVRQLLTRKNPETGKYEFSADEIRKEAIEKYKLDETLADALVNSLRPNDARVATEEELKTRGQKIEIIYGENGVVDYEGKKVAMLRSEIADMKKELASKSKQAKSDFGRVNDILDMYRDAESKPVGINTVMKHLAKQGLSESRIADMIYNYAAIRDLNDRIESAEQETLRVMDDGAQAGGESGKSFHSRGVATFFVSKGPVDGNVETTASNIEKALRNCLWKASGGNPRRYWDVELVPVINGKVDHKFGIITAHDLKIKKRLPSLAAAFGFVSDTQRKGGDGRNSGNLPRNGGGQGGVSRVAGENGGMGHEQGRGEDGLDLEQGNGSGPDSGLLTSESDLYDVPDPEEEQERRHRLAVGGMRWHSRNVFTPDDADYVSGAQESLRAHGFDVGPRERKKDADLDREAADLIDRTKAFDAAVKRGLDFKPLTDVEIRALTLNLGNRMADAMNMNLDAEEFERNDAVVDTLVKALVRAGSNAGAALRQMRHGFNLRTRDTEAYLVAAVRAKLEGEIEKSKGAAAVVTMGPEIERKMSELKSRIREQSEEMKKLHDTIDAKQAEIERLESAADERSIRRLVKEAEERGRAEGVRQANAEEDRARVELLSRVVSKYGNRIVHREVVTDAVASARGVFSALRRFAGNPAIVLTQEMKTVLTALLYGVEGDADLARQILKDEYADYDTAIAPYFEKFLSDLDREAAPADGRQSTKEENRRRIVRKRAEKSVSPEGETVVDVDGIFSELEGNGSPAGEGEPRRQGGVVKVSKKGKDSIQRLKDRMFRLDLAVKDAASDADRLAYLGEYVRLAFTLSTYGHPEFSVEERLDRLADHVMALFGGSFDRGDMKEAVLGLGAYKPVSRQQAKVMYEQLMKAKDLAEKGRIAEAAKAVGIEHKSDAEIVQELDRRLFRLLNQKVNLFESRLNEKPDAELERQIRALVVALHDIRSGKDAATLLEKYLDLAVGMKDYRRQRSVLDRINSRIDMYEEKLATGDFEPTPAREAPDTEGQLKEIRRAMSRLERLREKFKHERDAWRISKEPWLKRQWSTFLEILGEAKAIIGAMDLSSMLRQGGQMTFSHPLLFLKNFKKTLQAFRSEKVADDVMDSIFERPNAKYYLKAGIEFTDYGVNASSKEDMFLLNQYRRITQFKLARAGINASERAFVTFLNLMRADVFDAMVACSPFRTAENMTDEQLKAVGRFVNIASQRGAIDKSSSLGKSIGWLNAFLWSPRNLISRFQFIAETLALPLHGIASPYGADAKDAAMRRMFAKETVRYMTGVAVAIAFTKLMADLFRGDDEPPEDIVLDPRSSDFLKVKVGNTRLDFMSGLQQTFVFANRLLSRKMVNSRGETVSLENKRDYYTMIMRFLRSKFSPAASVIWDTAIERETFERQDVSWRLADQLKEDKEKVGVTRYLAKSLFVPLSIDDLREQAENGKLSFLPISWMLSVLGAGVQSYDPYTYKQLKGDFHYFRSLLDKAETKEERDRITEYHPMLLRAGAIDAAIKEVNRIQRELKKGEKAGVRLPHLEDMLEVAKKRAINLMAGFRNPMQVD